MNNSHGYTNNRLAGKELSSKQQDAMRDLRVEAGELADKINALQRQLNISETKFKIHEGRQVQESQRVSSAVLFKGLVHRTMRQTIFEETETTRPLFLSSKHLAGGLAPRQWQVQSGEQLDQEYKLLAEEFLNLDSSPPYTE